MTGTPSIFYWKPTKANICQDTLNIITGSSTVAKTSGTRGTKEGFRIVGRFQKLDKYSINILHNLSSFKC